MRCYSWILILESPRLDTAGRKISFDLFLVSCGFRCGPKTGFPVLKMNLQDNSYPRYQGNVPTSFSTGPTGQNWVEESR